MRIEDVAILIGMAFFAAVYLLLFGGALLSAH
jgi:hypothetical protein